MKYIWIKESLNTVSDRGWRRKNQGIAGVRDQIVKKNNHGTTRKVEEHFPRHVQGLGWRKNSRRSSEKLFGGPAEAKEPQKRYVQGLDVRTRDEGWLVGVRRGWRRKRVVGKCLTRRRVRFSLWPENRVWLSFWLQCFGKSWRSPPGAPYDMVGVWKRRCRKVVGKIRRKSCRRWVFFDDDPIDRKALGDGEDDRNETWSLEGFPESMTRGNWKELGFLPYLWYHVEREREKTLILIHMINYLQLRNIYTRLGELTTIHVTYLKKERLYTINTLYSTIGNKEEVSL